RACDIASSLINAARNLADRCVGAAPALGWTQSAIAHAAAVKESGSVIYECPGRRQIFADWTDIGVARRVVLEVLAREGAVFSPGLGDEGDMGCNLLFLDQPGQHRSRSVGRVRREPLRLEAEAFFSPLQHGPCSANLGLANGA